MARRGGPEGWYTRLEERDGELVPVLHYRKRQDYDDRFDDDVGDEDT